MAAASSSSSSKQVVVENAIHSILDIESSISSSFNVDPPNILAQKM
jgi:hypothetical protein